MLRMRISANKYQMLSETRQVNPYNPLFQLPQTYLSICHLLQSITINPLLPTTEQRSSITNTPIRCKFTNHACAHMWSPLTDWHHMKYLNRKTWNELNWFPFQFLKNIIHLITFNYYFKSLCFINIWGYITNKQIKPIPEKKTKRYIKTLNFRILLLSSKPLIELITLGVWLILN